MLCRRSPSLLKCTELTNTLFAHGFTYRGQSRPEGCRQAGSRPESLAIRVHRHPQAQDARALWREARGREVRTLPPLQYAPGDRGGFILDVLENYSTYKAYWRLLKKIEDDPRYDKKKAEYLLKSFVELHPHAIGEKVKICVEHFASKVQGEIGGRRRP